MHLPLLQAATAGDTQFIRDLIRTDLSSLLSERTVEGNSALHVAAKFGHNECVLEICKADLDSSLFVSTNSAGNTPLHLAAEAGNHQVVFSFLVELLLELKCQDNQSQLRNHAGDTPLHLATRNYHPSVVDLLMSKIPHAAAYTNESGISALYLAAERGSPEMVRSLLKSGEASHEGPRGQTALHAAVLRSHDIAKMILDSKPTSAKHEDVTKSTPLHFAATTGDVTMIQLLLDSDASAAYAQDEDGHSAMHIAAGEGHVEVIEEILSRCPDALEQRNRKGWNLLHVAIGQKRARVVEYALRSPVLVELVNQSDDEGNTPLHLAVISRNIQVTKVLTSHGRTDTSVMNKKGYTPVDLASSEVKSNMGSRMYNILVVLMSRGSRPSPQRLDHTTNHKEIRNQEEEIQRYRALCNNLAIIAVLVATVTFAAAFTFPGGYNSDQGLHPGTATLAKRAAFKTFLISDTLAMTISIIVTGLLIYSASVDHDVRLYTLQIAMKLMELAVCGMLVAFAAGVYVAVAHDCLWVSILVCLIVGIVPFCKYIIVYCTYSNDLGMLMVLENFKSAKWLKWPGFNKGKVNTTNMEEKDVPPTIVVRSEADTTNNVDKGKDITSPITSYYLTRLRPPQDMVFHSPQLTNRII